MFEPDTEDMLPRSAPKPIAPLGVNEAIVKPTVPEVSIIFNREIPNGSKSLQPLQSYANWKKHCLPKVSYPPSTEHDYVPIACSNVYPMRSATTIKQQTNIPTHFETNQQFRRSIDGVTSQPYTSEMPTIMAACSPSYTLSNQQRRSFESSTQSQNHQQSPRQTHSINDEVLTICAGTQTAHSTQLDFNGIPFNDLATKQDIDAIMKTLHDIRMEHIRLTEVCQELLRQQQKPASVLRDISTQCDGTGFNVGVIPQKRPPPVIYDYIEDDSQTDNNHIMCRNRLNQAHSNPSNSPSNKMLIARPNAISVLPKAATEKSMVMNELALKYLPNDKLSELLQELRMSPPSNRDENICVTTGATALPLKRPEINDKGPNDISNASYKYLKKYRLLPEEHGRDGNLSPNKQQHVPYHQARAFLGSHSTAIQPENIDLEALRRQPKFL